MNQPTPSTTTATPEWQCQFIRQNGFRCCIRATTNGFCTRHVHGKSHTPKPTKPTARDLERRLNAELYRMSGEILDKTATIAACHEKIDRLRSELDASMRIMGCGYCGQEIWKYEGAFPMPESVNAEAIAAFVAHDRACKCNPLAVELDASLRREGEEKSLLFYLENNCLTLECYDIPTGGDDADTGWRVIEYHMAEPRERCIGRGSTPRKAIQSALGAGSEEGRENRL